MFRSPARWEEGDGAKACFWGNFLSCGAVPGFVGDLRRATDVQGLAAPRFAPGNLVPGCMEQEATTHRQYRAAACGVGHLVD